VTALSGEVSGFVTSPLVTTSIPTFGPKRVIGANRVLSNGFQGGCATARPAAAMTHTITNADNVQRTLISIVMLLAEGALRGVTPRSSGGHGAVEVGDEHEAWVAF